MKVNTLLNLLEKDQPNPPQLKSVKMSKRYISTASNHQYHNDLSEYEYQDRKFDDLYDVADELEDNNIGPNKYGDYRVMLTADDLDSDRDVTYIFDIDLDQSQLIYLNYLLSLKKQQRNVLRDEQYDSEEATSHVA